jgi:hypothetical protein
VIDIIKIVIVQNPVEIYCFFRAWVSFFAYALKYNVSLVVVSKLGNIDRAYDSKVTLPFGLESFDLEALDRLRAERLLPNLKRHSKAPYSKGITKKDTHALP